MRERENMPETKTGTCPWCERHQQTLYFTIGICDGHLWTDWICARCRQICRTLTVNENED